MRNVRLPKFETGAGIWTQKRELGNLCREICGLCSGLCYEKQEIWSPQNSAGHVLGSARRNLNCSFGICGQNSLQKLTSSRSPRIWGLAEK
eukprot:scaffold2638_cov51-Phaeocystis_antarctica.AAC.1